VKWEVEMLGSSVDLRGCIINPTTTKHDKHVRDQKQRSRWYRSLIFIYHVTYDKLKVVM
jgi:hypothetical protein